jgi:phage anti-repressor protein
MSIDYIFICVQEANFCSRCFFININEFKELKINETDIKTLELYSTKNIELLTLNKKTCLVKNLLIQNLKQTKNTYTYIDNLWATTLCKFTKYEYIVDIDDYKFEPNKYMMLYGSFDHVSDYQKYFNIKSIDGISCNIIKSFLVLEKYI